MTRFLASDAGQASEFFLQRLQVTRLCIPSEAEPNCSGIQGSRAFMGHGRAVEPGTDSNSLPCQNIRRLFTAASRQEGYRTSLILSMKHPKASPHQHFHRRVRCLPLPEKNIPGSHFFHQPKSRPKTRNAGNIQCPRLQPLRKFRRHLPFP